MRDLHTHARHALASVCTRTGASVDFLTSFPPPPRCLVPQLGISVDELEMQASHEAQVSEVMDQIKVELDKMQARIKVRDTLDQGPWPSAPALRPVAITALSLA